MVNSTAIEESQHENLSVHKQSSCNTANSSHFDEDKVKSRIMGDVQEGASSFNPRILDNRLISMVEADSRRRIERLLLGIYKQPNCGRLSSFEIWWKTSDRIKRLYGLISHSNKSFDSQFGCECIYRLEGTFGGVSGRPYCNLIL